MFIYTQKNNNAYVPKRAFIIHHDEWRTKLILDTKKALQITHSQWHKQKLYVKLKNNQSQSFNKLCPMNGYRLQIILIYIIS